MGQKAEIYYKGVVDLCQLDVKAVHWHYTANIKTDSGSFPIDKVLGFDITRDYEVGFTDNFVIEVQMMKNLYIETLYPLRNNFKIQLNREQVSEQENGMKLISPKKLSKVYKGVLVNPVDIGNSPAHSASSQTNLDPNANMAPITVKIQLLPESIEQIMRTTFGGNFHGIPGEVVKGMLSKAFEMMEGSKASVIKGVEMVKPDNQKETSDIIIPHGTPVLDLPRKVQNECYGIYNYNIGSYLCNDVWYLYPLYRYDRYKESDTKLTISVVPKGKLLDSKRTYHVYNREVNILCAGGNETTDDANARTTNEGDGVTLYDPAKLRSDSIVQKSDGVYINPLDAKKQVVQSKREDDLNYAPTVKNRLTTSLHHAMSTVAQRNGLILTFVWEYSNPFLLVPGMPVKVVYFKDETKYELTGVLLKETSAVQLTGGIGMERHGGSTGLAVMVDQEQFRNVEKKQFKSTTAGVGNKLIDNVLSIF